MHSEDINSSTKDRPVEMVIFTLNGKEYGIPVSATKEVIPMTPIVPIPNTPEFIAGVLNLRGNILCIIDLKKQFHFPTQDRDTSHILVVRIHGIVAGLIVDTVKEVLKVMKSQIDPIPPMFNVQSADPCLIGIAKVQNRIITVLHLENIFSQEQWTTFHHNHAL
jgi:purine-binding chemotaxis protein CheW